LTHAHLEFIIGVTTIIGVLSLVDSAVDIYRMFVDMKRNSTDKNNIDEVPPTFTVGGTLGRDAVLYFMKQGLVHIYPFNEKQLNMNSYDVTLGKEYYTMIPPSSMNSIGLGVVCHGTQIIDPYNEEQTKGLWHKRSAMNVRKHVEEFRKYLPHKSLQIHLDHDSDIIILNAGDMILCQTEESIGGILNIFGAMSTRSTAERWRLDACGSAGFGDVGYINKWTMEMSNMSPNPILLVAGNRYAQIEFRMTVTC
jgi:deoxycytidine triphosphate deaminase